MPPESRTLRDLADELDARVTPGDGRAFVRFDDGSAVTIAGDHAGLVILAAAFARTAALAEADPDVSHTGSLTDAVFEHGSDLTALYPVYEPMPLPRQAPRSHAADWAVTGAFAVGCLGFIGLALFGLVTLARWAL